MNRDCNHVGRVWLRESSDAAGVSTPGVSRRDRVHDDADLDNVQFRRMLWDDLSAFDEDFEDEADAKCGAVGRVHEDESKAQVAFEKNSGVNWGRAVKALAAICALILTGIVPVMRLVTSESAQAISNARVITVNAPIDGELWWGSGFHIGTHLGQGDILLVINNPRADTAALDNVRRELFRLNAQKDTLASKITIAKQERAKLLTDDRLHRAARLKQFQARKQRVMSQISVAKANAANADLGLKRTEWLAERGLSTRVLLENKQRDNEVAAQSVHVLEHQLHEMEVEYEAALKGIRLTDDHNTLTHMKARAQQLAFEIEAWEHQLESQNQLIAGLKADLEKEQSRLSDKQRMLVSSPADGNVWEILASSGELVRRGQPLFRILDCAGAVVSSTVSEATYNRLRVGAPATFRSSSDMTEYKGHIVTMHGLAAPPANLAIGPANLHNEPFRVGVYSPDLAAVGKCTVGQTGIVKFGGDSDVSFMKRMRYWFDYWFNVL